MPLAPRDSRGPTQRHPRREPLESSVSLFLALATIALYFPVYVSQCQLIEAFGFGFTTNRFKFTNRLIKQPQVLLDAYNYGLCLTALLDDEFFFVLAYAPQDLPELCSSSECRHNSRNAFCTSSSWHRWPSRLP